MRSKRKLFLSIALLISTTIFIIAHLIYSSAQQDKEYPKKMSDLAFDNLDLDSHPGVGFELIFESDELIIFYGDFGLFGYNLKEQKMIFGVDFCKVYGKKGAVQGSYGTYAEASLDGKRVVFTYTDPDDPDIEYDAYYLDIPTLTYQRGSYRPIDKPFNREDIIGYVMPGSKISRTVYVFGDEYWKIFS